MEKNCKRKNKQIQKNNKNKIKPKPTTNKKEKSIEKENIKRKAKKIEYSDNDEETNDNNKNNKNQEDNNNISEIKEEVNKIAFEGDITEKLSNSSIYFRDKEKEKITLFIKNEKSKIKILFISGKPGTGKTSLVSNIFKEEMKNDNKYFMKFIVNCNTYNTIKDFYEELFVFLNSTNNYEFYKKVLNNKDYSHIIELLENSSHDFESFSQVIPLLKNYQLTMLLDEIDYLYNKNTDYLFYELLSIPHLVGGNIKLILISNNSDFDREIFPKLKNRNIEIEKIVFEPYTHINLLNIMKKKLEDINCLSMFSNEGLKFLTTKMNVNGDIRPIIEIVKNLILRCKDKNKKFELSDMFQVVKSKNINLSEIISSLTTEQKFIASGIYYASKVKGIEIEEKFIYDQYLRIKKGTGSEGINLSEFREILRNLCEIGLLEDKKVGKGKSKKNCDIYKAKFTVEDMEIIFMDPVMIKLFKSDINEIGSKNENEDEDKKLCNNNSKKNSKKIIKEKDAEEEVEEKEDEDYDFINNILNLKKKKKK